MARVTVEDCLENVDNRFELVLAATKRVRQLIFKGFEPLVPWENDKPTVVALREIAAGKINPRRLDDLEKIREQELQAARAGVSDSFIAGEVSLHTESEEDEPAFSEEETGTAFVVQETDPLSQEPTLNIPPRRKLLNSKPSVFEQVASRSGPLQFPLTEEGHDGTRREEGQAEKEGNAVSAADTVFLSEAAAPKSDENVSDTEKHPAKKSDDKA